MKKVLFLLIAGFVCRFLSAQEEDKSKWGIKFSGFVNTDYFYDSRQIICARQGHFLLWPHPEKLDPEGVDINARGSFNFLSIRTRIRGTITGPDFLGAKTLGVIEGSFFGHSNLDLNEFRLRHAFVKLNWEQTELLLGQYWNPMFIPECFPAVLSFNTGAPFGPFARNPQIRVSHNMGPIKLSAVAFSHADFASAAGIRALRNSMIPDLNFQLQYLKAPAENSAGILLGGGVEFKRLVPMIETEEGYHTSEGVGSFLTELYGKLTFKKLTIKAEGVIGQNNYDLLMISSFGIKSIDPVTGRQTYAPTGSYSVWTEIHSNNPKWQPGFFAGFTQNLGAGTDISAGGIVGTRGEIDYIYRLSPRLIYNYGKMRFGLELEYTVAAFGTIDPEGMVVDSRAVGNLRTLVGVFYFF
jgi:hypothetical protein